MTCVSTAQQPTEPVDTEQPLCSHIGTLCIHPLIGMSHRLICASFQIISYLLGLDRHASAYNDLIKYVNCWPSNNIA